MPGRSFKREPESPAFCRLQKALEAAVIVAALVTVPVTIAGEMGYERLPALDWALWTVFLLDYLVLTALSRDHRGYARRNLLSVVIIVLSFPLLPSLLDLVRLARLGRVLTLFRLVAVSARGVSALRVVLGRPGFLYIAGATLVLVLAGAGLLTLLEPDTVNSDYWTAVWWAIVTTTTVGYGDVTPSSPAGRAVGVLLMVTGVGLAATLAATVAAYFVERDVEEEERAGQEEIKGRLDRIEALLDEVVRESRKMRD